MERANLISWHPKYTAMISLVVMPLMLIQLSATFYLTYTDFNYILLAQSILVILLWASTFFQAVPLHNQIDAHEQIEAAAKSLVQVNWKRTFMWSVIVLLNLIHRLTT
jgi:hypothetical protein